jgi:polar amino acid transport system permease protein
MSLEFFLGLFPQLLAGTWITVQLLVISFIVGNMLALCVALARVSKNPFLWMPSYAFIYVIRGTPLLIQTYFLYYGLGDIFAHEPAIRHSIFWPFLREGFWYGIAALSLSTAAYTGEILRGAIQAVPFGEIEAGRAFGMSNWLITRRIVLPRALQICLPALSGEAIMLLKSTAIMSTITVFDMMGMANFIRVQTFRVYEPLLAAAVIYVALTFLIAVSFRLLERRINRDRRAPLQLKLPEAVVEAR